MLQRFFTPIRVEDSHIPDSIEIPHVKSEKESKTRDSLLNSAADLSYSVNKKIHSLTHQKFSPYFKTSAHKSKNNNIVIPEVPQIKSEEESITEDSLLNSAAVLPNKIHGLSQDLRDKKFSPNFRTSVQKSKSDNILVQGFFVEGDYDNNVLFLNKETLRKSGLDVDSAASITINGKVVDAVPGLQSEIHEEAIIETPEEETIEIIEEPTISISPTKSVIPAPSTPSQSSSYKSSPSAPTFFSKSGGPGRFSVISRYPSTESFSPALSIKSDHPQEPDVVQASSEEPDIIQVSSENPQTTSDAKARVPSLTHASRIISFDSDVDQLQNDALAADTINHISSFGYGQAVIRPQEIETHSGKVKEPEVASTSRTADPALFSRRVESSDKDLNQFGQHYSIPTINTNNLDLIFGQAKVLNLPVEIETQRVKEPEVVSPVRARVPSLFSSRVKSLDNDDGNRLGQHYSTATSTTNNVLSFGHASVLNQPQKIETLPSRVKEPEVISAVRARVPSLFNSRVKSLDNDYGIRPEQHYSTATSTTNNNVLSFGHASVLNQPQKTETLPSRVKVQEPVAKLPASSPRGPSIDWGRFESGPQEPLSPQLAEELKQALSFLG